VKFAYKNSQHIITEIISFYINYEQYLDLIIKSEKKRMPLTALMAALYIKKMTDVKPTSLLSIRGLEIRYVAM